MNFSAKLEAAGRGVDGGGVGGGEKTGEELTEERVGDTFAKPGTALLELVRMNLIAFEAGDGASGAYVRDVGDRDFAELRLQGGVPLLL